MSATFCEIMSKLKDTLEEEEEEEEEEKERELSNTLFSGFAYLRLFLRCLTL
jgi:hypothetical protein